MKKRRIVFLGMEGPVSGMTLAGMLDAGIEVVGIVLPDHRGGEQAGLIVPAFRDNISALPILSQPIVSNPVQLAQENNIPVVKVANLRDQRDTELIQDLEPDLFVTACFPLILPEPWLDIPTEGSLNLHPSLLPAYRGPYPLYWQFYHGEENTGVTLHFMGKGIDTGEIVAQKKVGFPEGITGEEADKLTAAVGLNLLLESLGKEIVPRHPQGDAEASYHSAPAPGDRVISTEWEAQRAFNFLRGADQWAPLWIKTNLGELVEVRRAVGYQAERGEGQGWIEVKDGWLQVES